MQARYFREVVVLVLYSPINTICRMVCENEISQVAQVIVARRYSQTCALRIMTVVLYVITVCLHISDVRKFKYVRVFCSCIGTRENALRR